MQFNPYVLFRHLANYGTIDLNLLLYGSTLYLWKTMLLYLYLYKFFIKDSGRFNL